MKDELLNVYRILLIRLGAMACYGKSYLSLLIIIFRLDELRVGTISFTIKGRLDELAYLP